MKARAATPGVVVGSIGLIAGLAAIVWSEPVLGLVAGLCAIAAGALGVRTAQQLDEQGQVQRLVEEELRSVRADAKSTEADLREELSATRDRFEELTETDGYFEDGHDPLIDEETGLFSEDFFGVALDSRVAAARRHLRPVAVVLLEVVAGLPGDDPETADPATVAVAVKTTLREADTACRLRTGEYALLLEDTPENGAIWTVERIRRYLADNTPNLTLRAGVACYPAHAFSPTELMQAADTALVLAREWRQDRIEVALAAAD